MTKVNVKTVVWKEGKNYVAWCLNTGISSFGDNRKKALESLQEALELYFEDMPVIKIIKVERPDIVPLTFKHA